MPFIFDLSYEYSLIVGLLALFGLLAAGFINGIFYWSSREPEENRPAFLKSNGLYFAMKIGEYTLLVIALYFLFISLGWITTAVAYLLMEYRWHHIMKPVYKKQFGIPSDKSTAVAA